MLEMAIAKSETRGVLGNFNQKAHPVNPVAYLEERGIGSIFRFILTHPDMDHMDGIKTFFNRFNPMNFWDTDNVKEIDSTSWLTSLYNPVDWEFYKSLRDERPQHDPKRLAKLCGDRGQYWSDDGITVLSPTQQLVNKANEKDDYNDCSYVLLYRVGGNRIIFSGDSHDGTWEHILNHWGDCVRDIDLLIAPHHGRDSGRSYDFLDVLRPSLTFFGNASSKYLAYDHWRNRHLSFVTNNQANCMVVDASAQPMRLYVTNEAFALRCNADTFYAPSFRAWYVCQV